MTQMSFGGNWTIQKLEILRRYLDAYTTALKNRPSPQTPFKLTYVDAFAGEGSLRLRHTDEAEDYQEFTDLVEGSAKIALDIDNKPFDSLIFIEKNQQRWRTLMQLRRDYPRRDINILHQDANDALPEICGRLKPSDRAVVFLDPFATEVSWTTIEALAQTHKIDSLILFPVSAIARLMPNLRLPSPQWAVQLDRIFGGREHWEGFYRPSQQPSLLDDETRQYRESGSQQIGNCYRERLTSAFHMVAPTSLTFRNSTNSPMFELFFAASNPAGAPIAVRIADHLLKNW